MSDLNDESNFDIEMRKADKLTDSRKFIPKLRTIEIEFLSQGLKKYL